MPYILQNKRNDILEQISLKEVPIETAGDLNYLISIIADEYISRKGKSYTTINEVVGALECSKLELYRRIAAPYEDEKILLNSDVYTVI